MTTGTNASQACAMETEYWLRVFVEELYADLVAKHHQFWPGARSGSWITENSIAFSISKILSMTGFDIFGEIDVAGPRVDMVLVNHRRKIIMVIELKKILGNKLEGICKDLERVSDESLSKYCASKGNNLAGYKKLGLFLGISMDDCWTAYDWWLPSLKRDDIDRSGFIRDTPAALEKFKSHSAAWGRYPEVPGSIQEFSEHNQKLVLCYALFDHH